MKALHREATSSKFAGCNDLSPVRDMNVSQQRAADQHSGSRLRRWKIGARKDPFIVQLDESNALTNSCSLVEASIRGCEPIRGELRHTVSGSEREGDGSRCLVRLSCFYDRLDRFSSATEALPSRDL